MGWVVCALALAMPFASMADAVLDWNELGVTAVVAARQSAPDSARTMAIVHVAMFNAVNAIEPRFRRMASRRGGSVADAAPRRRRMPCW